VNFLSHEAPRALTLEKAESFKRNDTKATAVIDYAKRVKDWPTLEADGEDKPERIMVRIKSNIGPSGGGFGYHIDMAPSHERPDIEATRIVWELPLEGTARELLSEAEGLDEDDKTSKGAEAKQFLKTALEKGERPAREIIAEAKAAGISERTLQRTAKEITGKRKSALSWYWWLLP
jgi:putative DNA primase/helicase